MIAITPKREELIQVAGVTLKAWKKIGVAGLLAAFLLAPFALDDFQLFQLVKAMSYMLVLVGLNMLTGYNGQFSLGQGAFFAVGAYTTAILMDQTAPWIGMSSDNMAYISIVVAAAFSFFAGYLFGQPATKLSGHYLALATFGLALAVPNLLKFDLIGGYTGGVQGILVWKPVPPFGLADMVSEDKYLYYVTLIVTVLSFLSAWNIMRGRTGRAIIAVRDHQMAASTMGVDVAKTKAIVFGLSAMYAGVGGALLTIAVGFVAPDSFAFVLSITFLIGMVIGGFGSMLGPVYGGLFLVYMPNISEAVSTELTQAVFGAVVILLMFFMPTGLAGGLRYLGDRLARQLGQPVGASATPAVAVEQPQQA